MSKKSSNFAAVFAADKNNERVFRKRRSYIEDAQDRL